MVLDYSARVAAVIRERELRGVGLLPGRNFYDLSNALHDNIIVVVGEIVLQCLVFCWADQLIAVEVYPVAMKEVTQTGLID
jgi:hypothetical protein